VEDPEIGHPDREFAVRAFAVAEDETVGRAIHGFEGPILLLDVESEHVILVCAIVSSSTSGLERGKELTMIPVTRLSPQVCIEEIGCLHFLISS
jgi:hypothetical protein